jgi:hypothetical protein
VKRPTAILVGSAVALALAAGGALAWVATRPSGPDETARAYLAALERGDSPALASLLALPERRESLLLETWAQAREYPRGVRLDRVTEGPDGAEAEATATVEGRERRLSFVLERGDGGWRVTSGATTIARIGTSLGDAVRVGDLSVPAGDVELLPGVYDFAAAPSGLAEGSASVAVPADGPIDADIDARLTPDAVARAQGQLDAYALACAAGGTEVPDACGLRIPWAADLATASAFAYRIEQLPALTIEPDGRTFAATGGVVVATVTGRDLGGRDAAFTYRNDAWTLGGDVRLGADGLTLSVR